MNATHKQNGGDNATLKRYGISGAFDSRRRNPRYTGIEAVYAGELARRGVGGIGVCGGVYEYAVSVTQNEHYSL